MNLHKQYKNPPIKEAIFAVSFKEPIDAKALALFKEVDFIKENFPVHEDSFVIEVSNKKGEFSPTIAHAPQGFRLRNENNLIDIKPTQISYHSIKKYIGWEYVIEDLRQVLDAFNKAVGPYSISQISTRYINQILLPLPLPIENIHEYISLLPTLPQAINPLNNFFLQINTTDNEYELTGIVTETILPQTKNEEYLNFLIDITVYRNLQVEIDDIWKVFEQIRVFKNKLFQSCVTTKTETLFNL